MPDTYRGAGAADVTGSKSSVREEITMLKSLSTFVTTMAIAATAVVVAVPTATAQAVGVGAVSLTDGSASAQNFDALAARGTTSDVLPSGWYFEESRHERQRVVRRSALARTTPATPTASVHRRHRNGPSVGC